MIDGRGKVWESWATNPAELRQYTLDHQVRAPYDFSAGLEVALKEFQPEALILLGPGSTSGGAMGQVIAAENWQGISSKSDFTKRQKGENPFLLAMGREEQWAMATGRAAP